MYVPKYARNTDFSAIKEFMNQNSFGILISQIDHTLVATHIPLLFSSDETKLTGHVSRANEQWKSFHDQEVLAIFTGPHAYISSSWYDHENVPTWNYIAAHVYGKIHILEGDKLYQSLKQLTDKYEADSVQPVALETMSSDYVNKEIKGLVCFEIEITRIEATYKLSQNRDQKNHEQIIQELENRKDPGSLQVAQEMKKSKLSSQQGHL